MMWLVTRPLLNADCVAEWARGEGFTDLVPSSWHVSVIMADRTCSLNPAGLILKPNPNRWVIGMGYLIALGFRSSSLARQHATHRRAGGCWDFASYRPHVSFTLRDHRDLGEIRPYEGWLVFGPETMDIVTEVDDNIDIGVYGRPHGARNNPLPQCR